MALVPASSAGSFVELDIGNSAESLGRLLDSQKELFHSQIDQLQKLVVVQCKLTGVNPLSQEMVAGALSIKMGKKPRDLFNPKAIKYMQLLFSIKDTIGKKETREISALCGITFTQVREYFAGQRSRVRKLVRLSQEKAIILDSSKATSDGCSFGPDQSLLVSKDAPLSTVDIRIVGESTKVPGNSGVPITIQDDQQDPVKTDLKIVGVPITVQNGQQNHVKTDLDTVGVPVTIQGGQQNPVKTDLKTVGESPSCSSQEETIPGIDSHDKKFLDNIFNLMRKEETFSGQVKLMEWILQIHNSAVMNWFLTKGGITILATWLSQAAVEEQTTVLLVIFKVLCHLPLHKALPVQMSAILQTANRLRFYRTSDLSNRVKILLSRWSKMFVRSQALRNPSFINSSRNGRKEIIRKQRISEILRDESWQSKIDIPEEILSLAESREYNRKSKPRRLLRLLPESSDGSNQKHGRSVSSPKIKERRKVLLVEQPDHETAGRSVQVARALPSNHSRPISADDIQKAKKRAIFMENKYGKTDASTSVNNPQNPEDHKAPPPRPLASNMLPSNKILPSRLKRDEVRKPPVSTAVMLSHELEGTTINRKPKSISKEQLWEKLKRDQLQWQMPPEIQINCLWRVGAGENSKEVEFQAQRLRREKETFCPTPQDIPPNPKEPWDIEMDFDDSLTPEITTEQPPSASASAADDDEGYLCSPRDSRSTADPPTAGNGAPEPDLELLAVLLKNPDLVFALTSGQGKNLTSDETVALLDMLKNSGVGLIGITNEIVDSSKLKPNEPEPTSLPSPTPPSDHIRTGWRSKFSTPTHAKTPLLQPHFSGGRGAAALPTIDTPSPAAIPQAPTTILSTPQLTVTVNPSPQHRPALNFVPKNSPAPFPHQTPPLTHQIPSWPPVGVASIGRHGRPHGLLDVPMPNPGLPTNHNNCHNMYTNGPTQRLSEIGEIVYGSETETWNREGSPMMSPDFWSSHNFSEPRREFDQSRRPDWSRQWDSGHRDHYRSGGGKRRRDRDHDHDRRR